MKLILQDNNQYILRFDRAEEMVQGIADFCRKHEISAGSFTIIGAVSEVTLSYYNLDSKKYEDKNSVENLEITGIIGNVAKLNGDIALHMHGTFSDRDMKVVGGHVKKMIVSGTGEVVLTVHEGEIIREFDESTGLNLMK